MKKVMVVPCVLSALFVLLAPTQSTAMGSLDACPNGWRLYAYTYSLPALPEDMQRKVREMIFAAAARDTQNASRDEAYQGDAVSRNLGAALRRLGLADDLLPEGAKAGVRFTAEVDLKLSYLDPAKAFGVLHVKGGKGNATLPGDPRRSAIDVIFPDRFVSPLESGGARRIRVLPDEWGTGCARYVSGIVP